MASFCVACGQEQASGALSASSRCNLCEELFRKGGGTKRDNGITTTPNGMRFCNITFTSDAPAMFCRECGGALEESRMRYALLAGGECRTCSECKRKSKH